MCFIGIIGIILMILENELTFANIHHKQTKVSFFIKSKISITTIILVGLVFYYHRVSLSLYAVNNMLNSRCVGLTTRRVLLILLEAFICLIHPFPRYFTFIKNIKPINLTSTTPVPLTYIDTDVALGLPSK